MTQQNSLSAFIDELRRRRVFRVAAFYGGIAFVIVQIIDGAFSYLHIPEWVGSAIIVLLLLGFPVSMILAWIFDITPEGIVRTKGKTSTKQAIPRTSNRALIAVTIAALAFGIWGRWGDQVAQSAEIRSIAVLPLTNLMGDADQDYFVEGMHESLTAALARIGALRVIGRTSTMSYKENPKPISVIAEELSVDAVVEGSVFRGGNKIRITVQLVATHPERHIWSDSYERDLKDILALQNDVARNIAHQIEIVLTPDEEARLKTEHPVVDPEAYSLYLQGRQILWNQLDWETGQSYLEKAIKIDPNFAPPYANLAIMLAGNVDGDLFESRKAKIHGLIEQAMRLDADFPDTYIALGFLRSREGKWKEAGTALRRALFLAPNSREANVELGWFLLRTGELARAVEQMELGVQLDPLSIHSYHSLATALYFQHRYDQARAVIDRALKLQPSNPSARRTAARIELKRGNYDEAIKYFGGWEQTDQIYRGLIYLARGEIREATQLAAKIGALALKDLTRDGAYALIFIYAATGQPDKAMEIMEMVYKHEHSPFILNPMGIVYSNSESAYDPLRGDPRFEALQKKIYGE